MLLTILLMGRGYSFTSTSDIAWCMVCRDSVVNFWCCGKVFCVVLVW